MYPGYAPEVREQRALVCAKFRVNYNMSKKICPKGTCPVVNNDGAESDAGSDDTGRTHRTGGSERSGKSGRTHRSGGSERCDKSGRTHRTGDSGKSRKSGGEHCEKKDEYVERGDSGVSRASSQKFSGRESMMDDGASEAGSVAGQPPPKHEKPTDTFGATGPKDGGKIGMVCRRSSKCKCGKCFTCKSVV
jgi:hypothetical protein